MEENVQERYLKLCINASKELTDILKGKCINETTVPIPVYGPNYKNDHKHNSLYVLDQKNTTKNDFDCDGVYIPEGFKVKLPNGSIENGPVAVKYNDLQICRVRSFHDLTWEVTTIPVGIFKPADSVCDNADNHVCWPIPVTFADFEKYGPKMAPSDPN